MKKASTIGIATTTVFYLLCGCIGYAAFSNNAPDDFLTDFGLFDPFWLGAYQVFIQPMFGLIDSRCSRAWPNSIFVNRDYPIRIPVSSGVYAFNWYRLMARQRRRQPTERSPEAPRRSETTTEGEIWWFMWRWMQTAEVVIQWRTAAGVWGILKISWKGFPVE